MSTIRRTTWHPLGKPLAGDLIRHETGQPAVPVAFGNGDDLILDDLAWARDLLTAVAAGVSVLEAEQGLPPAERAECDGSDECVHEAACVALEEERDTYRDLLNRAAHARTTADLVEILHDARTSLEQWGRS
ncbi:hypothetical protein ACIBKY_17475 [Nonomuraea sp. NPDC050394]|uniref:hypothetical protein n=1 Tax=Nonomuraea sp. NPDC050394 TaxID=3364363 RepID=UPI0037BD1F4A